MIQKLFNFAKKKSEYYLELDEDETLQDKITEAKEAVGDKLTEAKDVVVNKVTSVAEDGEEQIDSARENVETAVKSTKTEEGKLKLAADKNAQNAVQPSANNGANKDSGASLWEQPFWVKAMYEKNSSNGKGATEPESTFATNNLMPIPTNYRRRPGPSLDKYKAMANETRASRS
ncbi:hypothetical protein [Myxosarcina sp. GI1(2024)]